MDDRQYCVHDLTSLESEFLLIRERRFFARALALSMNKGQGTHTDLQKDLMLTLP